MDLMLYLAQNGTQLTEEEAGALFAAIIIGMVIGLAIVVAVYILIAFLLYTAYTALPEAHRKIPPWQIWLLLIPLFNYAWNFVVFLKLPDSFCGYFASIGRTDMGDCGRTLGLWYSILAVSALLIQCIPVLNLLVLPLGLAALVLLILFIVKMFKLKGQVGAAGGGFAPPSSPPPPPAP